METTFFNIAGAVNTALILLSLAGVAAQLRLVQSRRQRVDATDGATAVLSLNQFTVSFLAYLSFFVYGYSIAPFNHFIVWPRLLASLLVLAILAEVWRDRRSQAAAGSLLFASVALVCAVAGLLWGERHVDQGRAIASAMIVAITVLLAQGYAHQILLILSKGHTGAVSLRMSQLILLMDVSTIVFAFAMGLALGWPLLLLAVVSGGTKLAILWLFRWQHGPQAGKRRQHLAPTP